MPWQTLSSLLVAHGDSSLDIFSRDLRDTVWWPLSKRSLAQRNWADNANVLGLTCRSATHFGKSDPKTQHPGPAPKNRR